MKTQLILLSAIGLASAAQHRHGHMHVHEKKEASPADVYVAGPTVVVYSLNGQIVSEAEVLEGIKNGTLVWANGAPALASSSSSSASSTTFSTSTYSSSSVSSYSSSSASSSSISSASSSSTSSSASASASTSSSSNSTTATGIDVEFPDGTIACSTFPSAYGAIALDYLGLDGWTGIQTPGDTTSEGFSDIVTSTSGGCSDDAYCSYACPPGYQKSQWPSTQGSTGQSVGGLLCTDGYLYRTNDDYTTICIPGSSEVTVLVRNEMSDMAAVCRTDYPGTESETIPVAVAAGATENLTCPDGDTYYKWDGDVTSAQYYVNPAGVSAEDGCQWGSSANPWGNYAPINIGVGYTDGAAWLSIFQNYPTTSTELDFTIELEATDGTLSGTCRYSAGEFCSGTDYTDCNTQAGCTVSISSGTVTFVFSSSS